MTKPEKILSLKSYINGLNIRLTSPVPEKRKSHEASYRDYLRLEVKKATKTLEKLQLEVGGK